MRNMREILVIFDDGSVQLYPCAKDAADDLHGKGLAGETSKSSVRSWISRKVGDGTSLKKASAAYGTTIMKAPKGLDAQQKAIWIRQQVAASRICQYTKSLSEVPEPDLALVEAMEEIKSQFETSE